jgi:hypothetical protein
MGQSITVTERASSRRGVVRFELNRSLTGMGIQRFTNDAEPVGGTPAAELARRLFENPGVMAVTVYSNMVTVELREGYTSDGLAVAIENLFLYYPAAAV